MLVAFYALIFLRVVQSFTYPALPLIKSRFCFHLVIFTYFVTNAYSLQRKRTSVVSHDQLIARGSPAVDKGR